MNESTSRTNEEAENIGEMKNSDNIHVPVDQNPSTDMKEYVIYH